MLRLSINPHAKKDHDAEDYVGFLVLACLLKSDHPSWTGHALMVQVQAHTRIDEKAFERILQSFLTSGVIEDINSGGGWPQYRIKEDIRINISAGKL